MFQLDRNTFQVGEVVMCRGCFGKDQPKPAVITKMEFCAAPRMKEGIDVREAFVHDKERIVVTLDDGTWAYGFQIEKAVFRVSQPLSIKA